MLPKIASAVPPSLLATLVIALHTRPRQIVPLALITPPLFVATYLNLAGFPTAAAGITGAWSGLYAVMAMRRRQGIRGVLSMRGGVRGLAVGVGIVNAAAGGWTWLRGDYERDEEERVKRNRWGTA